MLGSRGGGRRVRFRDEGFGKYRCGDRYCAMGRVRFRDEGFGKYRCGDRYCAMGRVRFRDEGLAWAGFGGERGRWESREGAMGGGS